MGSCLSKFRCFCCKKSRPQPPVNVEMEPTNPSNLPKITVTKSTPPSSPTLPSSSASSAASKPVQKKERDNSPSRLKRQSAIKIKGGRPTVTIDVPENSRIGEPRSRLARKPTKYVHKQGN